MEYSECLKAFQSNLFNKKEEQNHKQHSYIMHKFIYPFRKIFS